MGWNHCQPTTCLIQSGPKFSAVAEPESVDQSEPTICYPCSAEVSDRLGQIGSQDDAESDDSSDNCSQLQLSSCWQVVDCQLQSFQQLHTGMACHLVWLARQISSPDNDVVAVSSGSDSDQSDHDDDFDSDAETLILPGGLEGPDDPENQWWYPPLWEIDSYPFVSDYPLVVGGHVVGDQHSSNDDNLEGPSQGPPPKKRRS